MEFGVLGPLLVRDADGPVTIASPKQRALLAILLLESPGRALTSERLIDELWGENPPATAGKALQVHVSQLRRTLGPAQPIATRSGGYAIEIEPEQLDLHRFEAQLANARRLRSSGEVDGALEVLHQALALWRGPALVDVTLLGPSAGEAGRLEALAAVAREERLELQLAQGSGAALVPELEALIVADPYREHIYALLMLALYRSGRQADALEVYRRARSVLSEELGLEPGPELVALEARILAQDPSLTASTPDSEVVAAIASVRAPRRARAAAPRPASSIVGRENEIREALALIGSPDVRLLTLTGAGGIGKTRLALEVAANLAEPACLVELSAISAAEQMMGALAAALGAEDGSVEAVAQALSNEPGVVILDNFEQVLDAAPAVSTLLNAVPSLNVVVTSRAPLHVSGEHELPVPPLPADSAQELFVRRAREQDPAFTTDAEELGCIAAICERIDRLPLAIELAAARAKVLRPPEILERIGSRLDLLTAGRRDAPERHRTLRATIAWSLDLLDSEQRRLFEQLAVFQSGWVIESAEAVTEVPAIDAMGALVDHCLVNRDGSRFRMLETVREYGLERLEESGDAPSVHRRHALWCLELAERAEAAFEGPDQADWFARLDAERENLRAAARWALDAGEPEITLGLDSALWRFWLARGAGPEIRSELAAALEAARRDGGLTPKALNAAGVLAGEEDDLDSAGALFEEALELATEAGDRRQMARTLMNLGVIAMYREDHAAALARYTEAGEIWQKLGDPRGQSVLSLNLAVVHDLTGHAEHATPLLERSVELARGVGDVTHLALTLIELGKHLVQHRLDDPRISDLLREGMELSSSLREQRQMIEGLEALAALLARRGAPVPGAELIGAAEAERARAGMERKPDELPSFETTIRELDRTLGRQEYERAYLRGYGRTLDVAIAVALKSIDAAVDGRRDAAPRRRGSKLVSVD